MRKRSTSCDRRWICRHVEVVTCLVVVSCFLLVVTNCNHASPEHAPRAVALRTTSAREFYPLALERAREWRLDAYLKDIEATVLLEDDSRDLRLYYGFESPEDDQYRLNVLFTEGVSAPEVTEFYHENSIYHRPPIGSEDWPIDTVDVLEIAQDNGGSAFLARYDTELVLIDLYLEYSVEDERLHWRASYWDWVTGDMVWIKIDPESGEVLEIYKMPDPSPGPPGAASSGPMLVGRSARCDSAPARWACYEKSRGPVGWEAAEVDVGS